ncbi:HAD-IB family hydrolase [uncultured Algimonas sp.]|uniref:HAD-IB family hydrolase n=1 Tax=uncultured Algimonas sp. TaxID=1547920 RepID=UPI00262C3EF0|nr:HAD-IB family hydrolase [uncultured Algimonas sp.]
MTELAVFDLDYTLTRRGTWGRFVTRALRGRPLALTRMWAAAGLAQWRYKRGDTPRIAVKTAMMRQSIAGRTKTELEAMAEAFVADDLADGMDPRVMAALEDHRARGHIILIASAAIDLLVERYAAALQADGQVSTLLDWTGDGRLASGFASENCYGEQKLERVEEWIADRGVSPDRVTAYSDSRSDAPLLEFADRAVIVNPRRKTKLYAKRTGLEVW